MYRLLLAILLASLAAPIASAASPENAIRFISCENYGNQIIVGGQDVCHSGESCENYGNQVFVGSTVECDGACPNHGIRIAVGSKVCGESDPQVCVGEVCVPWDPDTTAAAAGSVKMADCVPKVEVGQTTIPSIHVQCDPSGEPCGVNQQPICWTVRIACAMDFGLEFVLRNYENQVERLPPIVRETRDPSSCEGQPGWGGFAGVGA